MLNFVNVIGNSEEIVEYNRSVIGVHRYIIGNCVVL